MELCSHAKILKEKNDNQVTLSHIINIISLYKKIWQFFPIINKMQKVPRDYEDKSIDPMLLFFGLLLMLDNRV